MRAYTLWIQLNVRMQPCISRSDGNIIEHIYKCKYIEKSMIDKEIVYKMWCSTITCRLVTMHILEKINIYIYMHFMKIEDIQNRVTQKLNSFKLNVKNWIWTVSNLYR